jgi:FkbM family methyltransferase
MRVHRIKQAVSDLVFRLGMKVPGLLRLILPLLGRALPNLSIYNRFVRGLGLQIPVAARLGNGMRVRALLGDLISYDILQHGYYEEEWVRAVLERVGEKTVFFDIGANIGQYTLVASRSVREVHSFEPMPAVFELLLDNVKQNGLLNVTANQCALTNFEGFAELFEAPYGNIGASSLRRPERGSGRVFKVKCTTLDQYVASRKLILEPGQVFIKIDAEGAERLILEGADSLLSYKPTIMLELISKLQAPFGSSPMQVASLLGSRGYQFFDLQNSSCLPLTPDCLHNFSGNVLAVAGDSR